VYTDEVYGSLTYDGALLLRVPLCVSCCFAMYTLLQTLIQYPHFLSNTVMFRIRFRIRVRVSENASLCCSNLTHTEY